MNTMIQKRLIRYLKEGYYIERDISTDGRYYMIDNYGIIFCLVHGTAVIGLVKKGLLNETITENKYIYTLKNGKQTKM